MDEKDYEEFEDWRGSAEPRIDLIGTVLVGLAVTGVALVFGRLIYQIITGH